MPSQLQSLDGLSRKLTIDVPSDEVNKAFSQAYESVRKNAYIPGFRKGKAPMAKIRTLYKERVKQDVLQRLISKHYEKALDEHSLDPINFPQIDFEDLSDDSDFKFTAQFEIRPQVTLKAYENLEVVREKIEIPDDQVQNVMNRLQQGKADLVPVFEERPIQSGDVVKIDFSALVNNEPLENGSANDFDLEIGSNTFIPGFEEGLTGKKAGDTTQLRLNFPSDYHAQDVAGQPVLFTVVIKSIQKKKLPEINDDFAKAMGEFKTVEDLKNHIRDDIRQNEERRVLEDLKNRVIKELVAKNPVDVPRTLLLQQKERLIKDMQSRMTEQGLGGVDFEEYRKKWDADFEATAKTMIQSSFLIDAIAKELSVKPSAKDIDERIERFHRETGIELDQLHKFYSDKDRRSQLAYQLREEGVMKHLIEKARVTEVTRDKIKDEED